MAKDKTHALICAVCGTDTLEAPWLGLNEYAVGSPGVCWMSKGFGGEQGPEMEELRKSAIESGVVVTCWPVCSTLYIDGKFCELSFLANREGPE